MFRRFLTATLAIAALTSGATAAIRGHDSSPNTQQSPLASDGCTSSQKDTTNAMFPSMSCPSTQQIQVAKAKPQAVPSTQPGPAVAIGGGYGGGGFFADPTQQGPAVALGGGYGGGGGFADPNTQQAPDKAKVQVASADPIRGHDSGTSTDGFAWGG